MDITNLLLQNNIRKPGRYIGSEYNYVTKDWASTEVKFCLCYPDIYELGMSNLGIQIIYYVLNKRPDVLCERVFMPDRDMELALRREGIELFSLETRHSLREFDIIGFSLGYELIYINVLSILDLARIPLFKKERQGLHYPLIIAGGPCSYNPYPLSDFIDCFFIGEAEEAIGEIIEAYRLNRQMDKQARLSALSKIEGVFVPGISPRIERRIVRDLDSADYPVKPVVPFIEVVHDRINLEVMRGCPNRCYFCNAASLYYPLRIRRVERLLSLAVETYKNTGWNEIGLLSLSTSDYPYLTELLSGLNRLFKDRYVSLSLPSLRAKDLGLLPYAFLSQRRPGLTIAVEAGSERLRGIIGKDVDMPGLYSSIALAYRLGWRHIKLYFMIGLPGEREEDLDKIIKIAVDLCKIRRDIGRGWARVILSISAFIPKSHTALEKEKMDSLALLYKKRSYLIKRLSQTGRIAEYIKLVFHPIERSIIEAVLARPEPSLGRVIFRVWQKISQGEGYKDNFSFSLWQEALNRR